MREAKKRFKTMLIEESKVGKFIETSKEEAVGTAVGCRSNRLEKHREHRLEEVAEYFNMIFKSDANFEAFLAVKLESFFR